MEYTNGLVTITVNYNNLNKKNKVHCEKMMKEYAEALADFVDMCAGMQSSDEYMNETPLGHQIDGE